MGNWITNKGWELGSPGDWVFTGSLLIPSVGTDNPRSGSYNLHFATSAASIRLGRAKFTITDPKQLAALSGKTATFSIYRWCNLEFAGGVGTFQQIELGDEVSETILAIPFFPYSIYEKVSASHTIKANPTEVHFAIYWYKSGGGSIYHLDVDDMDVDVPGVGTPAVTTLPATNIGEDKATLNGVLSEDNNLTTKVYFEYGLTDAYGTTTAEQTKSAGDVFSQQIIGLSSNTIYHFRAVATNASGDAYGGDMTLLTGPSGSPSYWYHLNVKDINLPYEDLDKTKELHVVLKNLSPTAKTQGVDGAVKVKIDYEPAA